MKCVASTLAPTSQQQFFLATQANKAHYFSNIIYNTIYIFILANWFWSTASRAEAKPAPREIMADPAPAPQTLTPQFCFSTVALRDFLRISRSSIDDSITQNLNALVTPSTEGFDPSSTATRNHRPPHSRQISPTACQNFKNSVLFPSWQARSDVLNYCASVATSPDPDDPDLLQRQVESARERERVVDERLDPYSARFFPKEPRTEQLAAIVRQERGVEAIIRARTWGLVKERCGGVAADWEEALNEWRKSKEKP
ncbi:caffeine-induced death protein [Rutstroemia sp. NJR-2017a WRK4]|nr:caffeine-induced death protein [Rutstroemia sp. NJR-2017a WRK4]PQE14906.1 caffeine-induced death protein [Rutstroemia sp. NJR-2017a WRK4]